MSDHIPIADEFLAANRAFAVNFPDAGLQVEPTRHVAVVACMDSRMDMFQLLGLTVLAYVVTLVVYQVGRGVMALAGVA